MKVPLPLFFLLDLYHFRRRMNFVGSFRRFAVYPFVKSSIFDDDKYGALVERN
jgi:hypothetical protein